MSYVEQQFSRLEDRRRLSMKLRDGSANETHWLTLDETAVREIQEAFRRCEQRKERQDVWDEQR